MSSISFAYLGNYCPKRRAHPFVSIEALAARTGANLIWRPVLLGAIYRLTSAPQGAAGSASDVFNPTKKDVTSKAFRRTLKRYQIDYQEPPRHPVKTTAPLRLLYHVNGDQRPKLTKALFRAYWVEGKNVSDQSVLIDVLRRAEISDAESLVKAVENGSFEGKKERQELETATDHAVQRGSPGVPAFWIPNEVWTDKNGVRKEGRLYWGERRTRNGRCLRPWLTYALHFPGQDRMHFVEAVINALNEGKNGTELSAISTPLKSLVPRCTVGNVPAGQIKLEFYYDFSSPWAFLGWTQLARLQRQFGDELEIVMKPFLLGILFREYTSLFSCCIVRH